MMDGVMSLSGRSPRLGKKMANVQVKIATRATGDTIAVGQPVFLGPSHHIVTEQHIALCPALFLDGFSSASFRWMNPFGDAVTMEADKILFGFQPSTGFELLIRLELALDAFAGF